MLLNLESRVITHTKREVNDEDQVAGKLVQRSLQDAMIINDASNRFFTLLTDILRVVGLSSKVPKIPSISKKIRQNIVSEKKIPGVTSISITRQIDDLTIRARNITQRANILMRTIIRSHTRSSFNKAKKNIPQPGRIASVQICIDFYNDKNYSPNP
jgi:hypothetical protein